MNSSGKVFSLWGGGEGGRWWGWVIFVYIRGAYHLTEKSGWGVQSIMVSDLPVYRRIDHSRKYHNIP